VWRCVEKIEKKEKKLKGRKRRKGEKIEEKIKRQREKRTKAKKKKKKKEGESKRGHQPLTKKKRRDQKESREEDQGNRLSFFPSFIFCPLRFARYKHFFEDRFLSTLFSMSTNFPLSKKVKALKVLNRHITVKEAAFENGQKSSPLGIFFFPISKNSLKYQKYPQKARSRRFSATCCEPASVCPRSQNVMRSERKRRKERKKKKSGLASSLCPQKLNPVFF
jgi:hypothetical protein